MKRLIIERVTVRDSKEEFFCVFRENGRIRKFVKKLIAFRQIADAINDLQDENEQLVFFDISYENIKDYENDINRFL